jgi:hypothetical protein
MRIRTLIRTLTGPDDPLPLERLADVWTKHNVAAFASVAARSMVDEPGTVYTIPPLRILAFQTERAHARYQGELHDAAKAKGDNVVYRAKHVEELALFCRGELLKVLLALDIEATFQRDRFAYLRKMGGQ